LPITIYGDGGQTRDFIHVEDVAAANLQAMVTKAPNDVYNISTQTQTSVSMLVQQLTAIAAQEVPIVFEPPRPGDIYRSVLANSKAMKALSWQPRVAMSDGLARTYQYLGK
jgi:UDP-glucose 4-epimerase